MGSQGVSVATRLDCPEPLLVTYEARTEPATSCSRPAQPQMLNTFHHGGQEVSCLCPAQARLILPFCRALPSLSP